MFYGGSFMVIDGFVETELMGAKRQFVEQIFPAIIIASFSNLSILYPIVHNIPHPNPHHRGVRYA